MGKETISFESFADFILPVASDIHEELLRTGTGVRHFCGLNIGQIISFLNTESFDILSDCEHLPEELFLHPLSLISIWSLFLSIKFSFDHQLFVFPKKLSGLVIVRIVFPSLKLMVDSPNYLLNFLAVVRHI